MVAVILGQSNAANSGDQMTSGKSINYYQGRCYLAEGPMLGTSNDGGSMWPLLGDKLTKFDHVIFITAAVDGSGIDEWATGDLAAWLDTSLTRPAPYTATHFLWDQGEADRGHPEQQYIAALRIIIAKTTAVYPQSQFWITLTSTYHGMPEDVNIRQAQKDLVDGVGVFQGPDTDQYGPEFRRSDNVHFNTAGQNAIASDWAALLQ